MSPAADTRQYTVVLDDDGSVAYRAAARDGGVTPPGILVGRTRTVYISAPCRHSIRPAAHAPVSVSVWHCCVWFVAVAGDLCGFLDVVEVMAHADVSQHTRCVCTYTGGGGGVATR